MMTNETYRNVTHQLFTTFVLAGVVMAVPATAAVPAMAASSAAAAVMQVDRPSGWSGNHAEPVAPPPPVPPHGCDNENCGESDGGEKTCTDPSETGNGCTDSGEHGGTGGGPGVANARGIHDATGTSLVIGG
ncbi:hypothetical protein ACFXO9_35225 [Nocardia tengchongensis]|uniref:hypothetical protein n=1 Tax=Nocardia tengchongensis TaxID=2055889 RepID=UPI003674DEB2